MRAFRKKVGHPSKGPCQEEKPILCENISFFAELRYRVTAISTFAEISFRFRLQPSSRHGGFTHQDQGQTRRKMGGVGLDLSF
jgi:hypothetical protein